MTTKISRFYGLELGPEVERAIAEGLTDREGEDLVAAHLGRNYAYFGAVDKTLTGFVILDDEGDDYHLLDARGGGQVYWQDHETRELYLRFDSLADYRAFRKEASADGANEGALLEAYRPRAERAVREPSSAALCQRSQWLVYALAQFMTHQGKVMGGSEELMRSALGHLQATWPDQAQLEAAFRAELPRLGDDPHLALHWLLHAGLLHEPGRLAEIAAARSDQGPELWRAFLAAFGDLGPQGDVPAVPEFRARRSMAVFARAHDQSGEAGAAAALAALEMDARVWGPPKAMRLATALESDELGPERLAEVLARCPPAAPAVQFLRALLDGRAGAGPSPAADGLARAVARGELDWGFGLELLSRVQAQVADGEALAAAADRLRKTDMHHRRVVLMQLRAQELTGRELWAPAEELERERALAEASVPPLQALSQGEALAEVLPGLGDPALARVVARRLLMRAGMGKLPEEAVTWAFEAVSQGQDEDRFELLAGAFALAPRNVRPAIVGLLAAAIDGPEHPAVDLLLGFLGPQAAAPGASTGNQEFLAEMDAADRCEEVLRALGPQAHHPRVFAALMDLLESCQERQPTEKIAHELFYPSDGPACVVPRLSAAQAQRAATTLVALHAHPQIHVRNTAGHVLYRFHHPGAEEVLVAALREASAAYARGEEPKFNEERTANLYAAVRGLKTASSRRALLERLFEERISYWRLYNALKDSFDDALHAEALGLLEVRRDADGAAVYAAALGEFIGRAAPALELARAVAAWDPPAAPEARARLGYALRVGLQAALELKDHDAVRALWARTEALPGAPSSPYHEIDRKKPCPDPFTPEGPSWAALQAVLSGEVEAEARALRDKAARARARGKPLTKLDDRKLGALAGAEVAERLFHDRGTGEIWFLDSQQRFFWFDGYEVGSPPFQPVPLPKLRPVSALLEGATGIDGRVMAWAQDGGRFVEALRLGERVLLLRGPQNAAPAAFGARFPDAGAAAAFLERFRQNLPAAFAETSPWYVPGRGAVVRGYYCAPPGGKNTTRGSLYVLDGQLGREERFASDAEAIAAHQARELRWLRDESGVPGCVEWMERLRRDEDRSLAEWLEKRARDDGRDLAWHVEALRAIPRYLEAHGLLGLVPGLQVELGDGAPAAELEAFQRGREQPLPEALKELWTRFGHGGFRLGAHGGRFLSPREALARRDDARRTATDTYLPQVPEGDRPAIQAMLDRLDVIAERADGSAGVYLVDAAREDGRVFSHAAARLADFWWEKSLQWELATELLSDLVNGLRESAPTLGLLWYGQRLDPAAIHKRFELKNDKAEKFWEVRCDPGFRHQAVRHGKLGLPGKIEHKRFPDEAQARKAHDKAVAEKLKKGYREVARQVADAGKVQGSL